jgi:putative ABC transport system substrate-binding protein
MTILRIKRRAFIAGLGGAAAWPVVARGQQADRVGRVGVLMGLRENDPVAQVRLTAFRKALQDQGWMEGRNVRFEVRWSGGEIDRVHAAAAELVQLAPDVILANGTPAIAALKQATSSIPIVFVIVNDPVAQGFISSVAHPGGNITGFSLIDYSVIGKALELLKQMAPSVARVGFMFNPNSYPYYEIYLRSLPQQQRALGLDLTAARVHSDAEIEEAISMMSYAPNQTDIFRRSASYVDRILRGANPGDLPAQAPTKFEFVLNLKTAKVLGLDITPQLLARADEVIE